MGIRPEVWDGLKSRFSRMANALHGKPSRIITIPKGSDELGCTSKNSDIHLNPNHELVKMLSEPEAIQFITGVYGHEDMHQHMTDFTAFDRATKAKPEAERGVFHMLCNIIEDPAIEYGASRFFGGKLLKALHFSVLHIYRQSPPLDEEESKSEQFFSALIQYGDGGILKGNFTYPEARKTFREVLPYVDRAIEEPDCKKRIALMKKVYEISRPLWIDEIEALQKLIDLLKKLGRDHSGSSGRGDPSFKSGEGETEPTKTEKRRKITVRRISKEEAEATESGHGESMPNVEFIPEGEPVPKGEDDPVPGGEDVPEGESVPECEDVPKDKSVPDGEIGQEAENELNCVEGKTPAATTSPSYSDCESSEEAPERLSIISDEEFHLSDEELETLVADAEAMIREGREEKLEQAKTENEPLEIPEMVKRYPRIRCSNQRVTVSNPERLAGSYAHIIASLAGSISILVNQFKRIFRADIEERERRTSGRLNIRRLSTGTPSTRIFDRKRQPGNKQDTAVMIAIDESLSMHGEKTRMAMQTAILLAEVFAKVGITVKIIGFTDHGGKPIHYHYTSWQNTAAERLKLLNISARADNFDGYTIRYCGELLKKRPESHKMLIVVSDGQPATHGYRNFEEGIADTRNAIREVSKFAKVFGVLIGSEDVDVLFTMYGTNFLHISNVTELPQRLGKKISVAIKNW